VYLHATGGAYYLWAPASTLNDPLSPDPIAHPVTNTTYSVSVYDTLGCPKHTIATVDVTTFRGLIAVVFKDTMVVQGEPVQLQGYGGQYYQWKPATWLSDPNISNPIARPFDDVTYTMVISNDDNCTDSAKVRVRAFKDPDLYVPTAFTPNSDGLNDLFKVVPVGFTLTELKIFDRWGNLMFMTRDETKGWDGTYKGQPLNTATFIWVAAGKNKKTGAMVTKKGQITLIR
jgi:gliding motility-associated-like protein